MNKVVDNRSALGCNLQFILLTLPYQPADDSLQKYLIIYKPLFVEKWQQEKKEKPKNWLIK